MGASPWALNTIKNGFRLLWHHQKPLLQREPVPFPPPVAKDQCSVLDLQVVEMLGKGAIERVDNPASPGFYSRLFTVPKPSGGYRPILDLSPLNKFLKKVTFKMDSPDSIRGILRRGDWATSLDLKDAYFHVPISPKDRKWLRFMWRGEVFQYKVLPFGLSLSPWAFTKIVREVVTFSRSNKMRLHTYLDDWLTLASIKGVCSLHMDLLRRTTQRLGFVIHEDKSEFTPSQEFTYLGMSFNTATWTVQPSQARRLSLSTQIRSLRAQARVSARSLSSVLGKMESMARLLPLGRLHKRPFQRAFTSVFCQEKDSWNRRIDIQPWFHEVTLQWLSLPWLASSSPITLPDPVRTVFTDASKEGWGGHMLVPLQQQPKLDQ